jgi:hypothetical protein
MGMFSGSGRAVSDKSVNDGTLLLATPSIRVVEENIVTSMSTTRVTRLSMMVVLVVMLVLEMKTIELLMESVYEMIWTRLRDPV